MSELVNVAQGVTDDLNDNQAKFSVPFCAVRSYADWDIPLENAKPGKMYCDVVPVTFVAADREARAFIAYETPIEIIFRLQVDPQWRGSSDRIPVDKIDPLQTFVEGVYEFMMAPRALNAYPAAACIAQAWVTSYGQVDGATESRLRLQNQWTSVFRLTYHSQKEV